jgi:serine/threonine-protein kinase RsbW
MKTERRRGTTRSQARNAVHRGDNELSLSIPSSLSAIEPLCERIRRLLEKRKLERLQFAVEILARECLNNAILHGNQGVKAAMVNFAMRIGRKRICLRVSDEGPGFNWWRVRHRGLPADTQTSGRGLLVAELYAQRVAFNRQGNQVTMWINTEKEGR